jgi:23S rRNA (cytosine1962-C5)-methyltransferase
MATAQDPDRVAGPAQGTGPGLAEPGLEAYELLDAGDGRRLERFGRVIVDRPAPAAVLARRAPAAWDEADLRFDRDRGWSTRSGRSIGTWPIRIGGLVLELRPTASGQLGLYPDHLASLPWLEAQVARDRATSGSRPEALNLFASTGLATLALASAGAEVVHVDASRPTVRWARANADASGLTSRPIRWIVDDALAFCRREVRRGRRYDVIVLDPPSYGHGPSGRGRRLDEELGLLLAATASILRPLGSLLVTTHTPGLDAAWLARLVRDALGAGRSVVAEPSALVGRNGATLEVGAFARTEDTA